MRPPAECRRCAPLALASVGRVTGDPFTKRSWWEAQTLKTVARDNKGKKDDFITLRRINDADQLIQTNIHGKVQFERVFVRK